MYILDPLKMMQRMLKENYDQYISGEISEKEYIDRAKPIDQAITKLEMISYSAMKKDLEKSIMT